MGQPEDTSEANTRAACHDAGCCLFARGLEALPIPFVVFDPHRVLFTNRAWNSHFTGGADSTGMEADSFLHEDNLEVGRLRRIHLSEHGISLDNVHVHARAANGTSLRLVVANERIAFGTDQHAVLILHRRVNDEDYADFVPLTRFGRRRPALRDVCAHEAAFEAMPIPLVITRGRFVVKANLQARLLFSNGSELAGTPALDLVHLDGSKAAAERRELLHDHPGHVLRGVTLPLADPGVGRSVTADVASFLADGEVYGMVAVRSLTV